MQAISKILSSILQALYQETFAAILFTVIYMIAYMYFCEHGVKETIKEWGIQWKKNKRFRRLALLVFYTMMILYRTVLCRVIWGGPLGDVIGTWTLYKEDGSLYTENIENVILFLPFSLLFLWVNREKKLKRFRIGEILLKSTMIAFVFSITIETLQLFLKIGTWQLSDLFFNTLGGLLGGVIYWICYRIKKRKSQKQHYKEKV